MKIANRKSTNTALKFRAGLALGTLCFLLGCGSTTPNETPTAASSTGGGGGAGGAGGAGGSGGGAVKSEQMALLDQYLIGDFDNSAQYNAGFSKLVERHVCVIPGRDLDPTVSWLYVEHVEVLADGTRDAYFTRVNEIREVNGNPVSRAYKFASGHPLATDAFQFNGPRDGCLQPKVLEAIKDSDLVYRDGCDVTFVRNGNVFDATTPTGTCTFPGGYIKTTAKVFADGMDVTDLAVAGSQETGDTFEFRRLMGN